MQALRHIRVKYGTTWTSSEPQPYRNPWPQSLRLATLVLVCCCWQRPISAYLDGPNHRDGRTLQLTPLPARFFKAIYFLQLCSKTSKSSFVHHV